MATLRFNNHAGYLLQTDDHLLLVDPWLEGTAFHDGWALLDASTSNAALVDLLQASAKPVTVWYSHEHSDHFSLSFLRALKQAALPDVRIAYQRTLDHRVAGHLRKMGWPVVELRSGEPLALGRAMTLRVWPFLDSGDSFSLVQADDASVLNLNDCALDSPEKLEHVRDCLGANGSRIDLLLTQFGYANWIGNEADVDTRREAAAEKIRRVVMQVERLAPGRIVPFASFVRFCHEENVYLNDAQNTVDDLVDSPLARAFRERFHVMRPGDRLNLNEAVGSPGTRFASEQARAHWRRLAGTPAEAPLRQRARVPLDDLKVSANRFRSTIGRHLAWTSHLAERLGVIRPVTIHLTDLDQRLQMSYRRGLRPSTEAVAHFACTSEVLDFVLKNDYGFNTTLVNGRFRTSDAGGYRQAWRFFILQDLKKMGLSVSTPWTTLRVVARNVGKFMARGRAT
jgi:hypothetical protein